MLKRVLIYLTLSILVVFFARYAHVLFIYIDILYTKINLALVPLFSNSPAGTLLRSVLMLTLFPIAITAIPALIYYAFKRKTMPYYIEVTWFIWFVIVIIKIIF